MNSTKELTKDKRGLNKIELKDIFKNIKSNYILKKIFYNLMKKKSLDIIKYNKNIKERMNISIKDYNEYLEIYSSIEIELNLQKINMEILLILMKTIKILSYIF